MADVIEIDAEVSVSETLTADYDSSVGGGGGVAGYQYLPDKPSINGVTLVGDKTSEDLGLLDDVPDFTPVSGSTPAVAGLVPSTGGHTTLDDVRVLTDEGWQTLTSYLDTSSKNPPKSYAVFDYINAHTVNDVKVNGTSAVTSGTANINNFVGGSPTSANNKAGLVPQPPTLEETGQLNILTDAGWKEAYPQQDSAIPWASKNSPAFTGTPTAPTALSSTDNTQIATTAFVHDVVDALGTGVSDVKVDDVSVVTDGVAEIPTYAPISSVNPTGTKGLVPVAGSSTVNTNTKFLGNAGRWQDVVVEDTHSNNILDSVTNGSPYNTTFALKDATTSASGLMSSTDKTKLNGIASGADVTSVTQTLTSGTEIGEINGTKLYAPSGGGGGTITDVEVNGTSVVTDGVAEITLATVATTGDYDDLTDKPTIPRVGRTIPFVACDTSASTAEKSVTITGISQADIATSGMTIAVNFTYTNSAQNPTLRVNGSTAKPIVLYGTTSAGTSPATSWNAGETVILIQSGTSWQIANFNNTTYTAMSSSEMQTGTATTGRIISAARLKAAVEYHAPVSSVNGSTGDVTVTVPTDTSDLTNGAGFITGMTILSYGSSTWSDFIAAYNANKVVYCRASSGSNPASGSQTRLAFMAYVNNASTPTEVEFQYYRSIASHSDAQQGDQVFVYKLTSTGGWSVTTREAYTKIAVGGDLTNSYSNGTLTISGTIPTVPTNVSSFTNDAGYLTLATLPIYNGGVS